MRKKLPKILVTGGAGFIGSAFVRLLLSRDCFFQRLSLIVVDKLTYAGDLARISDAEGKCKFYKADIGNKKQIELIFKNEKPDILVNFAAETHVDRSILDADNFIETNIRGAQVLLETSRKYNLSRFIQVSTDEIYGDIEKGEFTEDSPLNPSSPYSASKAAADLLVKSYIRTFQLPAIIVRPSNNFGPWQYPEKFIPVVIYKAMRNEKIPVYGNGLNVREWLYVGDCADAILNIALRGRMGGIYNLGSGNERKNIDVAKEILKILGKPRGLIEYVNDRPGHDLRYSLNFSKIRKDLGWQPRITFEAGLIKTVNWYRNNTAWLEKKVKYLRNHWKDILENYRSCKNT